jgi:hypothetical protein
MQFQAHMQVALFADVTGQIDAMHIEAHVSMWFLDDGD